MKNQAEKDLFPNGEKVPLWQRIVPRILQSAAWYPGYYLLLKFFLRMQIYGAKNLKNANKLVKKQKRAVLLISNHISEFDPIITLSAIKPYFYIFPLFWVARPGKYYKDPDFSWRRFIYGDLFLLSWGAQPIHQGQKNYELALRRHVWLLKNGYSVCIFPQGGIGKSKVHGGAGFLIDKCDPIVIPIKIEGLENINSKEFWARKRKLKVEFGKPIENAKDILENLKKEKDRLEAYREVAELILNFKI